jgi:hypothetical protein
MIFSVYRINEFLVITSWHVLRLLMEKTASRYAGIAVDIVNKQSRT